MPKAKVGNKVKVKYNYQLDGINNSNAISKNKTLTFTVGKGKVNSLLENEVIDMKQGGSKTIKVGPELVYGIYKKELVFTVEKSEIPINIDLKKGMRLNLNLKQSKSNSVLVKDVSTNTVTFDANHPYAGKSLVYQLDLLDIK